MVEEIKALIAGLDHMDKGMKKKQLIELQTCKELLSGWDFEQMIEQLQEHGAKDTYYHHDRDRAVIEQYDMANPIDVKRWRASMSDKMIEKKKNEVIEMKKKPKSNKSNEMMKKNASKKKSPSQDNDLKNNDHVVKSKRMSKIKSNKTRARGSKPVK